MYLQMAWQLLGLASDASERDVRKAYARLLKQIDQETDAAGFQHLREAYELALGHARNGGGMPQFFPAEIPETQGVPNVAQSEPEPEPEPEPEDKSGADEIVRQRRVLLHGDFANQKEPPCFIDVEPGVLAQAVFDEFIQTLVAQPPAVETTALLIERAMNDERVMSLDARHHFEGLVADRLARGWQPGNEALLTVAADYFGWGQDRRRLFSFQQVSWRVDAALNELVVFNTLQPVRRSLLLDIIRQLRTDANPSEGTLRQALPMLRQLVNDYPMLLPLITSSTNIEKWLELGEGLRIGQAPEVKQAPLPSPTKRNWFANASVWLMIIFAIRAFFSFVGSDSSHPSPVPVSSSQTGKDVLGSLGVDAAQLQGELAQIKAIVEQQTISAESCNALASLMHANEVVATYPQLAFDALTEEHVEQRVLDCVAKQYWVDSPGRDFAVESAHAWHARTVGAKSP